MLKDKGLDAVITPGGSGQFDVLADGEMVFSKQEQDRFPETDEILSALTDA